MNKKDLEVNNVFTNLTLKDMAEHLIKILVDNMQPDPEDM